MTFADWLDKALKETGVSQYALAKAAKLSSGRIAAYMRKGGDRPTLESAQRICRALGLPLSRLERDVDIPPPSVERAKRKETRHGR